MMTRVLADDTRDATDGTAALLPATSVPLSVPCLKYWMATFAKANETLSVGVSSPPEDPLHWMDSTMTSVKSYFRKICCPPVPVALRMTICAVG